MGQKFEGLLLVSDVDGTLVYDFDRCPQRNIDAVRYFQEQGGRFTIATGRHVHAALKIADQFAIHTPLILINGGCIYDPDQNCFLHNQYLPQNAYSYLSELAGHPKLSNIRIMTADDTVQSVYMRSDADRNGPLFSRYPVQYSTLESIKGDPWRKALLITTAEESAEFRSYVDSMHYHGVDFVASSEYYYEMLAAGVNKAAGIQLIAQRLEIAQEQIIAIGDYENDADMIRYAGLGACPANAVEAVKSVADLVVGDCREGAVADLVEYLDTHVADHSIMK